MRRPRNIAIKLVLLLLLGAIVNVAVAWGCAIVIDPYAQSGNSEMASVGGGIATHYVTRYSSAASDVITVGSAAGGSFTVGRHPELQSLLPAWADDTALNPFKFHIHEARGVPYRCLYAAMERAPVVRSQWKVTNAIETKLTARTFGWTRIPCVLPLRPIWPGFAINTIFYAGVLWLLFAAPGSVRRRVRRFRGRCIHCGYDLRGQLAGSKTCPECGGECARSTMRPMMFIALATALACAALALVVYLQLPIDVADLEQPIDNDGIVINVKTIQLRPDRAIATIGVQNKRQVAVEFGTVDLVGMIEWADLYDSRGTQVSFIHQQRRGTVSFRQLPKAVVPPCSTIEVDVELLAVSPNGFVRGDGRSNLEYPESLWYRRADLLAIDTLGPNGQLIETRFERISIQGKMAVLYR